MKAQLVTTRRSREQGTCDEGWSGCRARSWTGRDAAGDGRRDARNETSLEQGVDRAGGADNMPPGETPRAGVGTPGHPEVRAWARPVRRYF